jgi:hypothetical protein
MWPNGYKFLIAFLAGIVNGGKREGKKRKRGGKREKKKEKKKGERLFPSASISGSTKTTPL